MTAHTGDMLVADRFRLGRVLGAGGMGVVYEAEQIALRRTVALKMLARQHIGAEHAIERLIREARSLSRIDHPGVVRVLDAGRAGDGQAFLAMEYLEGCTLRQLLAEHGPLPWRWVIAVMTQSLEALELVHRAGLVHRDLKPSNIFCCSREPLASSVGAQVPAVKLIDFGIAQLEPLRAGEGGARGADGLLAGTPAYWAPELVATGRATRGSDVYGMGATLYELLTGALPQGTPLEPPSAVNSGVGIPPDLDAVVLRALHPDVGMRFDSAAALLEALRGVDRDRAPDSTWPGVSAERVAMARGGLFGLSLPLTRSGEGAQLARLRAKVRAFWIDGVLDSSLATELPSAPRTLELGQVGGLGQALEAPPPVEVPPGRSTAELFEQHGRSLLILGPAGSGKTTQLLLVARELIDGAQEAVPVVLTLSAWKGERLDLEEWLASELRAKYHVPGSFSSAWLRSGLIMPLLDGLDEAPPAARGDAIRAINAAVARGRLPGILVTSRSAEYGALGERLGLSTALCLHPLAPRSVDEFCATLARSAALPPELWERLRPLLDTPLALSLLASSLSAGAERVAKAAGAEPRFEDLLEAYTEQMIQRTGKPRLPCDPAEFREFVTRLGHELSVTDTVIFAPDAIQPSWLASSRSKVAYALLSRFAAAGVYAASQILTHAYTPISNYGLKTGLGFGLALAASTVVTSGAAHGLVAARRLTNPAHAPPAARRHWLQVAGLGSLSGLLSALILWRHARHPMAGVIAFEVGMLAAPLLSPHPDVGHVRGDIRLIDELRFSLTKALRAGAVGLVVSLICASVLAEDATAALIVTLFWTTLAFLFGGLRGREVATAARPYMHVVHSLGWSAGLGALGVVVTALPMASEYGGRYGLFAGLFTGTMLWLWYGGMALTQYGVLRALLRLGGARCFQIAFLEAAADRALLHRVGDGYLFVHPMLRASLARRWRARHGGQRS